MAMQPIPKLFSLLGLVYWGDIGDLTIYKSQRGKLVWLLKTYPKRPGSTLQQAQRAKIVAAAKAWHALTNDQRNQYHLATRRASLLMHGYDLWVWASMGGDPKILQTIARQTDTTLPYPEP